VPVSLAEQEWTYAAGKGINNVYLFYDASDINYVEEFIQFLSSLPGRSTAVVGPPGAIILPNQAL
jgi:hypothetical protein